MGLEKHFATCRSGRIVLAGQPGTPHPLAFEAVFHEAMLARHH
jgi:hypothetical protein